MWAALWYKPIEMLSGLMMCAVGIYAALYFKDPNVVAIGGALTTLGGVLVSWSASTVNQHNKAAVLLRPQLESATRHLSTVSSQLSSAATALRTQEIDEETAYYMVAHANQTLLGSISDIQKLVGSELDLAPMWENATRVADLAEKLIMSRSDAEEAEEEENELRKELSILKAQINTFAPSTAKRTYEQVMVACPNPGCKNHTNPSVSCALGSVIGDTQVPACSECKEKFFVHRSRDGIITRRQNKYKNAVASKAA